MGPGDVTRRMPRVQQLYMCLSASRFAACQGPDRREKITIPVWELDDPDVQQAWRDLTDPKNLAELEEWLTQQESESIKADATKALEVCRQRAAGS